MHASDKKIIIDRYESRLQKYGPVPQTLGWFKGRQKFRFHFLVDIDGFCPNDSILDVGCAYGDLEPFLRSISWKGDYLGIDIVSSLIEEGKKRYPFLDLRLLDIQEEKVAGTFDWVLCSGALTSKTAKMGSYEHIQSMLSIMFDLCRKGVSVNFASPHVDYQSEINFHPDMSRIIEMISGLTRRFSVRHDYMPYEFTAYLYKESEIVQGVNIFKSHHKLFQALRTD